MAFKLHFDVMTTFLRLIVLRSFSLQIIEQQACEMLSESKSSGEESAKENDDDDEDDKDVPMAEMEVDIPLTKAGYAVPPAYPPIQASSFLVNLDVMLYTKPDILPPPPFLSELGVKYC